MPDADTIEVTAEEMLAHSPDVLAPVESEWLDDFSAAAAEGREIAGRSSVVFIGLARSIADVLPFSILRIKLIASAFADWHVVIVENDSTDNTRALLQAWELADPDRVRASCWDFGHEHLHGFESLRVERYAQYRNTGRILAQQLAPDADYVIVLDLDAWGGYSQSGVCNSLAWLNRIPTAGCMASVSLFEIRDQFDVVHLCHYDQWAFRWESWTTRIREWFTRWIPPIGSPPMLVRSAFGGLAVYKATPFFAGEYQGGPDIEHVGLHRSLKALGYDVYLNSSSRVTMHWITDENDSNA